MKERKSRMHRDSDFPRPSARRQRPAFAPVEMLIAVALIGLLACIAFSAYRTADTTSDVARAKADLYTLAIAMEAYFADNHCYPATTIDPCQSVDAPAGGDMPSRTFRQRLPWNNLSTLTTPVAYIGVYPPDPFATQTGITYRAWTPPPGGWILGSWGPDRDEARGGQLEWNRAYGQGWAAVETVYIPVVPQPSIILLAGMSVPNGAFTYDPTNGAESQGDIWRVRFDDRLRPKDATGAMIH